MNSVLQKELVNFNGSLNYWLGIIWLIVILGTIITIFFVTNKRKENSADILNTENRKIIKKKSGNGFKLK